MLLSSQEQRKHRKNFFTAALCFSVKVNNNESCATTVTVEKVIQGRFRKLQ